MFKRHPKVPRVSATRKGWVAVLVPPRFSTCMRCEQVRYDYREQVLNWSGCERPCRVLQDSRDPIATSIQISNLPFTRLITALWHIPGGVTTV